MHRPDLSGPEHRPRPTGAFLLPCLRTSYLDPFKLSLLSIPLPEQSALRFSKKGWRRDRTCTIFVSCPTHQPRADQQGTIRMAARASFATAERLAPGVRLHRPQQRRQVVAGQYAHRSQRPAKVSGTPGKTRLINHFRINDSWYLVDLPGYRLRPHVENPTRRIRQNHHRLTYSDANGCTSCSCWSIPDWSPRRSTCASSKCSVGRASLSASSLPKPTNCRPHSSHCSVERYKQVLGEQWEGLPPMFRSSSETDGREEILDFIGKCLTEC